MQYITQNKPLLTENQKQAYDFITNHVKRGIGGAPAFTAIISVGPPMAITVTVLKTPKTKDLQMLIHILPSKGASSEHDDQGIMMLKKRSSSSSINEKSFKLEAIGVLFLLPPIFDSLFINGESFVDLAFLGAGEPIKAAAAWLRVTLFMGVLEIVMVSFAILFLVILISGAFELSRTTDVFLPLNSLPTEDFLPPIPDCLHLYDGRVTFDAR
ncbi:hypothetical protein J437_LFUL004731 [Ladona fulva]|uniref:Uncharacterized protein n=1 Tax=Ladona fulva TaxID=123851 RepID=A0A8K0NTB2_LADFU|nr:hypothetical protein J437_LFUL004731 [Ladona fulva]